MRALHSLIGITRRLLALGRHRRIARDVDDEVAFHLAMREADLAAASGDAARQARRQFGNVTAITEETREMWRFPSLDSIVQDTRYALRGLRRSPGFAALTIAMLALGIGANTAIFSLLSALLVRGLPFDQPDRLVMLIGNVQREQVERRGASYPDFADWRAQARSFEDLAVFDTATVTAQADGEPERVTMEIVSASYFPLLRIAATTGRTFTADEDAVPGRDAVVVIGDGLARRWFATPAEAAGRTIRIGRRLFTVVGVAPAGFRGVSDTGQLWLPSMIGGGGFDARGTRGIMVLGRLQPGVGLDAARQEMDGISARLATAFPDSNTGRGVEISPLAIEVSGALRPALLTLMLAVGLVLLIACANVANLLMARAESRQREMAVRASLGAGRARIVRQLVTESVVLTGLGALAGLGLAYLAVRALVATAPVTLPSFARPELDVPVLLFTSVVAGLTGLLLGLAPAWHTRSPALGATLKDASRGSSGVPARRLRGALIAGEIALAVILLAGAGLLIRSIRNVSAVDPGFDAARVLTLRLDMASRPAPPAEAGTPAPPTAPVVPVQALLDSLGALPGVTGAAVASDLPLGGESSAIFYSADGGPPEDARSAPRGYLHRVTPAFFDTLGMPLVAGRTFTAADLRPDAAVVIVSQQVARRFWPDADPIGRRIRPGRADSSAPWLTVIGVAPEVKYRGLPENPTADPDLYLPLTDRTSMGVVLRTDLDPDTMSGSVRAALRSLHPSIVVFDIRPLADRVREQSAASRFTSWLMAIFAGVALVLAAGGVYGVMSYVVARRTREFGIRLALGATRIRILQGVVGDGARLVASGVLIGAGGAVLLGRILQQQLFGVSAFDPSTLWAVAALSGLAIAACVLPALRATRVDPVLALRND